MDWTESWAALAQTLFRDEQTEWRGLIYAVYRICNQNVEAKGQITNGRRSSQLKRGFVELGEDAADSEIPIKQPDSVVVSSSSRMRLSCVFTSTKLTYLISLSDNQPPQATEECFWAITQLFFWPTQPEREALFLDSRSERRVSVSPRFKSRCLNQQRMWSSNQGFRMISI